METVPQMGDELRNRDGNSTREKKNRWTKPILYPLPILSSCPSRPAREALLPMAGPTTAVFCSRHFPDHAAFSLPYLRFLAGLPAAFPLPYLRFLAGLPAAEVLLPPAAEVLLPPAKFLVPSPPHDPPLHNPQPRSLKMCSPIWRSSGASEAALNTINKCRSLAMRQSSGSCYVVPGNKSIIDGLCCVFGIPDTKISKA